MTTLEQRVGQLEGAYTHLATKADVAELRVQMGALESRLIKWMVGLQLGGIVALAALVGAVVAVLKYLE